MSCCEKTTTSTIDDVKDYYGKILKTKDDLKTNACKTSGSMPPQVKKLLGQIHDEVLIKYYGCGLTIPGDWANLKGKRVLDLGSGSGRDCYLLSQIVGESGSVVGVDMTEEQISLASSHIKYHMDKFGYKKDNVRFIHGYIEKLDQLGLEDNSFDLIISNCVINLSPDKDAVLRQAYRLLKPGGELYFSDVYANKRIPEKLQQDKVLWGECLSGALYVNDFLSTAKKCGFTDPRMVSHAPITVGSAAIKKQLESILFASITFRLWKLESLEAYCEDYGQAVSYLGSIPDFPLSFPLDAGHSFEKSRISPVCGNTWLMLHESRLKEHFAFYGDWSTHFGVYKSCGEEGSPFSAFCVKEEGGEVAAKGGCC